MRTGERLKLFPSLTKLGKIVREEMIPQSYYDKMLKHFSGDKSKTYAWFSTPNPTLNGFTPLDAIKFGKQKKLIEWIDEAIKKGYQP
jgi:hypothetical protein